MSNNCLKCSCEILPDKTSKNLPAGLDPDDPEAKNMNGEMYFICPSCNAKNAVNTFVINGLEITQITHLIDKE